jgi:glycogen synthase
VRGWRNPRRRLAMQRRAMSTDWSWRLPAEQYLGIYRAVDSGA